MERPDIVKPPHGMTLLRNSVFLTPLPEQTDGLELAHAVGRGRLRR
jgi:hypothetical protein